MKKKNQSQLPRRQFCKTLGLLLPATCFSPFFSTKVRAKQSSVKNIVFIISDQHRYDATSHYGNPDVATPNIDRIGNEGAIFRNHYCQHPICVPSRQSIITSQYPSINGINSNTQAKEPGFHDHIALITYLRDTAGYRTWLFGKSHMSLNGFQFYIDNDSLNDHLSQDIINARSSAINWYKDQYKNTYWQEIQMNSKYLLIPMPAEYHRESLFVDQLEQFFNNQLSTPFFLWISFPFPHPQTYPPEPYYSKFKDRELATFPEWPVPPEVIDNLEIGDRDQYDRKEFAYLTPQMVRNGVRAYYACVEFMDSQVGRVLDLLEKYNLSNNTIVVYTADHGEMLGHNGLFGKSTFYEPAAHIPCVMRSPGDIEPGTIIEKCTGSIDLMPTMFDFANIPFPNTVDGKSTQGQSMRRLLQDSNNDWIDQVFCEQKLPNCMVRSGYWKYIHYANDEDRLYNLEMDPQERINYIDDPLHQNVKMDLQQRLADTFGIPLGIKNIDSKTPGKYRLDQNYPNPFNASTRINFYLPQRTRISLDVYNIIGQRVATLIDEYMTAGEHTVQFEGNNLPAGSYAYYLKAEKFTSTKWMQLIK